MINKKFKRRTIAALAIATAMVTLAACGKKMRDAKSSSSDKAGEVVSTVPENEDAQTVTDNSVKVDEEAENGAATVSYTENTTTETKSETKSETKTSSKSDSKSSSKSESKKNTTKGTSGDAAREEVKATSATRNAVVATAKAKIGTEFALGGVGPDTFDNSGFVYYCYKTNGVTIPRLASDMALCGKEVSLADAEPGDIMVFSNSVGGPAEFVGIYTGNKNFIASYKPGKPTKQSGLAGYWDERLITVRRL